tara:strand:- start:191 stop:430 length:240 start_codon:yes stop_codon:yes gene_type:complete
MNTTTKELLLDELEETIAKISIKKTILKKQEEETKEKKQDLTIQGNTKLFLEFWEAEIELLLHRIEKIKSMLIKDSIHI